MLVSASMSGTVDTAKKLSTVKYAWDVLPSRLNAQLLIKQSRVDAACAAATALQANAIATYGM